MIQRKQTLFLLLVVFSTLALVMIPCNYVILDGNTFGVSLFSLYTAKLTGTFWHSAGMILNVASLALALITIFLYKQRVLQVRLCFILMLLEVSITLIVSLCPIVVKTEGISSIENSGIASIVGVIGMMSAYLAARYIKKDIELLKSADRIR